MTAPLHDGLLQVFDVDHGACALLTMPSPQGNRHILIDCGHNTEYKGGPWYPGVQLRQMGIKHLDALIVTNYDEDHVSGDLAPVSPDTVYAQCSACPSGWVSRR